MIQDSYIRKAFKNGNEEVWNQINNRQKRALNKFSYLMCEKMRYDFLEQLKYIEIFGLDFIPFSKELLEKYESNYENMMQEYSSEHEEEILLATRDLLIKISDYNQNDERPPNELIIKIVNLLEKVFLYDDDIGEFSQFLVENTIKNIDAFQIKNEFYYELTNFDCLDEIINQLNEKGTPGDVVKYFDEKIKNFEENVNRIIPIRDKIIELRQYTESEENEARKYISNLYLASNKDLETLEKNLIEIGKNLEDIYQISQKLEVTLSSKQIRDLCDESMSPLNNKGELRKKYIAKRIKEKLKPTKEDKQKEETIEDYVINKSLSYNANLNKNYIDYIVDRLKRSTVDFEYEKDLFERILLLQSILSADLLKESSKNYTINDIEIGAIDNNVMKKILIEQLKKLGITFNEQGVEEVINDSKRKSNFLFSISHRVLNAGYTIVEDNKTAAVEVDVNIHDIFIDEDYLTEIKQNQFSNDEDIPKLQQIFDLAKEIQKKLTTIKDVPNQIKADDIKENQSVFESIIFELRSKYNLDIDDDTLTRAINFAFRIEVTKLYVLRNMQIAHDEREKKAIKEAMLIQKEKITQIMLNNLK